MKIFALKFKPLDEVSRKNIEIARHFGSKLIKVYATSFCDDSGDIAHVLCAYEDTPFWHDSNRETAEKASVTDTPYYNAEYDTPKNRFAGDLEVVEINIEW